MTPDQIIDSLKTKDGLTDEESNEFVRLLGKLDRIRLACVAGYAWGLATKPRHTNIKWEEK